MSAKEALKTVGIIGAGFAGLSAACYLAKGGLDVTVIDQHEEVGGRARSLRLDSANGVFTFDMGPSWYWMPDIFEEFFTRFNYNVSDFYELKRLDPSYEVVFREDSILVPAGTEEVVKLFEEIESGSGKRLRQFLTEASFKYQKGMYEYTRRPSLRVTEFFDFRLLRESLRLDMFRSMRTHVARFVSHPYLRALLEFPVLFLGSTANKTPALYSLMNYADIALGTWHPLGGMAKIPQAMAKVAKKFGVKFKLGERVSDLPIKEFDYVVGAGDYAHMEKLLPKELRSYEEEYWDKRVLAPSSILFYVGIKGRIEGLQHHTLFFDEDLDRHATEIYQSKTWPSKPLFYVCAPSVSDSSIAPSDCENLFFLIPVASELYLEDSVEIRERYFEIIFRRFEERFGRGIKERILVKHSFGHQDFINEYGALRGNAYGLANTLSQTAIFKPKLRSKKVKNLFFAGQLTVPGPGVPPSIISGEVVSKVVLAEAEKRS